MCVVIAHGKNSKNGKHWSNLYNDRPDGCFDLCRKKLPVMKNFTPPGIDAKALAIILFLHFTGIACSQTADSTKQLTQVAGSAGITNNGISVVPVFSFGKPAAILLMSVGKNRLSFEPDVRVSLDLKRGGMALWWRYKFLMNGKFRLNAGAHPAVNFIVSADSAKESAKKVLLTQKFLGGELAPYYLLSKNVSVGMYYLYGHGLQKNGPRNVHFVTINSNFSNIKLTRQFILQWIPQLYYLNVDKSDGVYFTSTVALLKSNFPLSLQSTINKMIRTNIPGSKNSVWNVTLCYSFEG